MDEIESRIWSMIKDSGLSYTEKFDLQMKAAVFVFYENLRRTGRKPDLEWLSEQFAEKGLNLAE